MGRSIKTGLDYFPFDIDFFQDLKIRKLVKYQGGKAITVYALLLCSIYKEGYYMRWDEELPFIISEQSGYDEAYIGEVVKCCMNIGLLNKDLYEKNGILTSKGIQERYTKISSLCNRKGKISEFNLISSQEIPFSSQEIPINSEKSTQSKVKESKEKKKENLKEEIVLERRAEVIETFVKKHGISLDQFCKKENITLQEFRALMEEVLLDWELQGWNVYYIQDGKEQYQSIHLQNTIRIKKEKCFDLIQIKSLKEKYFQESALPDYKTYLTWADKNVPYLSTHATPLTEQQFVNLKNAYGSVKIRQCIEDIESRKDLREKYSSLYRTLLKWLKNGYNS